MNGTIQEITSLLAAAKPLYFGRAERVKRLASQLAKELGIQRDRPFKNDLTKKYKRDFIIIAPTILQTLSLISSDIQAALKKNS